MNAAAIFSAVVLSSSMTLAQQNPQTQPQASAPAQIISDAQIAQMFKEINQADIDGAQMAEKKTKSNQIKVMAQQLERDHKDVQRAGDNTLKKLKMSPEESEGSRVFKESMQSELNQLKNLKGVDFDNAYLQHEVNFHKRAHDLVDQSLLPNAKSTEWKDLLNKEKTILEEHLQHVQTIQLKMPHK